MNMSAVTARATMLGLMLWSAVAHAVPPQRVSIDPAPLGGAAFLIAFDFTDGGPPSNSIAVGSFATDGALGSASTAGSVSGALPAGFTLSDGDFFNELLQGISGAGAISFEFAATANAPAAGSLPDTFAVFLLHPQSQLPLFATTDPSGSNALLTFQIDPGFAEPLTVYSAVPAGGAPVTWSVTAVPEPSSLLLSLAGAAMLLGIVRRRH